MSNRSEPTRRQLQAEEQRRQAQTDIDEVQAQVEAGELDADTARNLIQRYRREIAAAMVDDQDSGSDQTAGETNRRRWVGAAVLLAAFAVAAVLAAQAIEPRPDGTFITGGPGDGADGVNLDDVSNDQMEAVIAANPDQPEVAQMRIALANRYFDEADFSAALDHYIAGMGGQLRADQRAQALGRVGWMTYLSGRTDLAQQYVEEALTVDAAYAEGTLFLGLIQLYGNDDPAAALPLLQAVAARDDLPPDVRTEVEDALAVAESNA